MTLRMRYAEPSQSGRVEARRQAEKWKILSESTQIVHKVAVWLRVGLAVAVRAATRMESGCTTAPKVHRTPMESAFGAGWLMLLPACAATKNLGGNYLQDSQFGHAGQCDARQ